MSARSPRTVHPSGGRRASPPWTQGPSPGAFGPHARAVTAISWDRRPRTTFLGTFALQPVGPRKAQKNHSKTLNIDLSLPDRPRLAVVSFQRYSHGAVRAAATLDEALSPNLNPVGRRCRTLAAGEPCPCPRHRMDFLMSCISHTCSAIAYPTLCIMQHCAVSPSVGICIVYMKADSTLSV